MSTGLPTSKAETLAYLQSKLTEAMVPGLYFFTYESWQVKTDEHLSAILKMFQGHQIVVRSSALNEDTAETSNAGAFLSFLDLDPQDMAHVKKAVNEVFASYQSQDNKHQVLVQQMITDIAASGVITSHVIETGAGYYVLNYDDESGRTDTITGGTKTAKTVYVQRNTPNDMVHSQRIIQWLTMVKEVEAIAGNHSLDIEFALDKKGRLYLLQARRIAVETKWNKIISNQVSRQHDYLREYIDHYSKLEGTCFGHKTILGQMPDWNPAEIIGSRPRPMAVSLYEELITNEVWREARALMGYHHPKGHSLMVQLGNSCYIDVRASFNSFLPAGLSPITANKIMNAWLDRLDQHPEFHDKVEFEIATTVKTPSFKKQWRERYVDVLDIKELNTYEKALTQLTENILLNHGEGSLNDALEKIDLLERKQKAPCSQTNNSHWQELWEAKAFLYRCKKYGTLPFAIIARCAFVAEDLLRSFVMHQALSEERLDQFKQSIVTISKTLSKDYAMVFDQQNNKESFLRQYGHLRPGTYDIRSQRYDQRKSLFDSLSSFTPESSELIFQLTQEEEILIKDALAEAGLTAISTKNFFEFARKSIEGREYAKYVFTKDLSNALECIALWGEKFDLNREVLSFIPIQILFSLIQKPHLSHLPDTLYQVYEQNKKEYDSYHLLHLSYIIRGATDTYVIPVHRSMANFVTQAKMESTVILVDTVQTKVPDLKNKIVCIESADPGFDWIFTRNIAGLITKFGGTNSHMAIRCAEYGLPAAIGVGEHLFDQLRNGVKVELNGAEKIIRVLHA